MDDIFDDELPDCSEMLDDFISIAGEIADGDTLILKIANDFASIELLTEGYSVFKQERKLSKPVPDPEGPGN